MRHDSGNLLVEIIVPHEPHIPVRNNPNEFPVLTDRHAGNFVASHNGVCILYCMVGGQEKRVDNDPVFRTLDAVY